MKWGAAPAPTTASPSLGLRRVFGPAVRALTLFATHYFEITRSRALAAGGQRHLAATEHNDRLVFLPHSSRACEQSFGLQVAKLAGIPAAVIDSAKAQLAILEGTSTGLNWQRRAAGGPSASNAVAEPKTRKSKQTQQDIFASAGKLDAYIAAINPDRLTPLDALKLIYKLKEDWS